MAGKPCKIASRRLEYALDTSLSKNALIDTLAVAAKEYLYDVMEVKKPTEDQLAKLIDAWATRSARERKDKPVDLHRAMARLDESDRKTKAHFEAYEHSRTQREELAGLEAKYTQVAPVEP